jgi:CTD kinase subunit beta
VGPQFPADRFLTVRIPLNQEASEHRIPRYANWEDRPRQHKSNGNPQYSTYPKDTDIRRPHHPLTPTAANGDRHRTSDRGKDAAVRFMLDHDIADCEKRQVAEYFRVEMEEHEVDA